MVGAPSFLLCQFELVDHLFRHILENVAFEIRKVFGDEIWKLSLEVSRQIAIATTYQ